MLYPSASFAVNLNMDRIPPRFDVHAEVCYPPANAIKGAMSKDMQQHCSKQVKRAKKPDVWSG